MNYQKKRDVAFTRPTDQGVTKQRTSFNNKSPNSKPVFRNGDVRSQTQTRGRGKNFVPTTQRTQRGGSAIRGGNRGRGNFRNNDVARTTRGNTSGRGRGGNRAGSRPTRGRGKKVLDKSALDRELDKYMLKDKEHASSVLDSELEAYMKGREENDNNAEEKAD